MKRHHACLTARISAFCVAVALVSQSAQADGAYRITPVNPPVAGDSLTPVAINDQGTIAGSYSDSINHGFISMCGHILTLDDPNADPASFGTVATAINSAGTVAGWYVDINGNQIGFTYKKGNYTDVNPPGSVFGTTVTAISNSGIVAGYYFDGNFTQHGFVYSNNTYTVIDPPGSTNTTISSINSGGVVAGSFTDSAGSHGFTASNGRYRIIDVPGANQQFGGTSVTAINDENVVAGNYFAGSPARSHGFTRSSGVFKTIDPAGSIATTINGINEDGTVVGLFTLPGNQFLGFVASQSSVTVINPNPSAFFTSVTAINDDGDITGFSIDSTGVAQGFIGRTN